ncbi:MAG: hypothetical protein MPJ79_00840 [Alphaproteobacteria bacterium]|nr:hypothetical protein [Alphaproteobacteria bacterium]MDA8009350.1 hypothetical protein [Alphaproteobacteria bacterium]
MNSDTKQNSDISQGVAQGDGEGGHIVAAFDRSMVWLRESTLLLGRRAAERLGEAVPLLAGGDAGAIRDFAAEDQELNALGHAISDRAIETIAIRQPMAQDLRELVASLRISRDLERIADCSVSLAKRGRRLTAPLPDSLVGELDAMARSAQVFLSQVMTDYEAGTTEVAERAQEEDDLLDRHFGKLIRLVLAESVAERISPEDSLQWFSAAKLLERAGDHTVHVANSIYYICHGEYLSDDDDDDSA